MRKDVILTGIRANNNLHIGHYFGPMLPIIDMAKRHAGEYQINMFIPDLHSFTTPVEYGKPLHDAIINNARIYAAAGLPFDNDDIYLYRQSYIPAHSEMTWILDCFTGMGHLERMTQFKDKSAKLSSESISAGLFNYPVLMAADILLYGADVVPVGGGLSRAPGLVGYLDEAVRVRLLRKTKGPLLVAAECGADAGLLGAAMVGVAAWG